MDRNEIFPLLYTVSTDDLLLVVRDIETVINLRRNAIRQESTAKIQAQLLPLYETVAALQAEFDAATLPVKKRYLQVRLDAAIRAHDDVAHQLEQLQYTCRDVNFFDGPAYA